jgi:hypothetical protein
MVFSLQLIKLDFYPFYFQNWEFHIDDRSKASSTDLLGELCIILIFNNLTVTWDTDTIPMKDKGTLNTQKALVEVYLASTEPQSLVEEFFRYTQTLDEKTCNLRIRNQYVQ